MVQECYVLSALLNLLHTIDSDSMMKTYNVYADADKLIVISLLINFADK